MLTESRDLLDEIFEKTLRGPRIFKNKSVLFHDYIPSRLLFRDEYISRLGHLFAPLLRGQRSSNLFIYGKPGTGKTAVTRYVINRLQKKAKEINSRVCFSYVNCRITGTEYRVAFSIARDVGVNVPFTGLSVKEVIDRFKSKIISDNVPVLIVLDEIDALVTRYGDDLLYTLTRINDSNQAAKLMIVGISNDLRFKEYLDPRVLSSLSEEEIVFKPYTPEELEAIIMDRASEAFFEGTVSLEAIKLCAAISGAEHGDARKALDLIRVAGEIAEELGANKVKPIHVQMARDRIERDKTVEVILSLPLHSRLILTSILLCLKEGDLNSVRSSVAYSKYCELANLLSSRPLSSRRFIGLVKELSILGLLDKRIENYGRRGGRVTMIRLALPMTNLERILKEDPVIRDILLDKT